MHDLSRTRETCFAVVPSTNGVELVGLSGDVVKLSSFYAIFIQVMGIHQYDPSATTLIGKSKWEARDIRLMPLPQSLFEAL